MNQEIYQVRLAKELLHGRLQGVSLVDLRISTETAGFQFSVTHSLFMSSRLP